MFCCLIVVPDTFYENLKKLRLDDNFIVKSISTTVLNRVSYLNHYSSSTIYFSFYFLAFNIFQLTYAW